MMSFFTATRRTWALILGVMALSIHAFQPFGLSAYLSIHPQSSTHHTIPSMTFPESSNSINESNNGDASEKEATPLDCLQDAVERMHILQQPEDPTNDHIKPLLPKQFVRVGPSSIPGAGNGAFVATERIPAGTIIGFYPVHGIGLERFDINAILTATKEDKTYFDSVMNFDSDEDNEDEDYKEEDHNYLFYLIDDRPVGGYQTSKQGGTLFVDVNPNQPVQDPWIGHYLNDGDVVKSYSDEGLSDYYRRSTQRRNCFHIPFGPSPMLAVVTSREVSKGEELFATYGGSYWLDSLVVDDVDEDDYDDDYADADDNDDNDEAKEELVGMSDRVQQLAAQTVQQNLDAMLRAQVTHSSLQANLERLFLTAKQ